MNALMSRISGLGSYAALYLVFLYLPIVLLPVFSFNDGTIIAFPFKGFTLKWYAKLAEADALIGALGNSLMVATATGVVSTTIGLFAARAFVRHGFIGRKVAEGIVMVPLVIPGIIVATAMLVLFISMGLRPSLVTVAAGHVFLALPFSVSIIKSSFENFDPSLEEAAIDLGENIVGMFWRVTLPIVTPALVASFLITFTVSFDEFVLAFFLAGNEPTLPVYIWSQIRFPSKLPNTLALATLLLLGSVVLLLIAEWFRRRSTQGRAS